MIRRLLIAVAAVVVLGGCRVDTNVTVTITESGAGSVTVAVTADAEVIAKAPEVMNELRLGDLAAAGWSIDGPESTPGGGATLILTRPFANSTEGIAILGQIGGPQGPFGQWGLTRSSGYGVTTSGLTGSFAVRGGIAAFADDKMADLLGGPPLGDRLVAEEQSLGDVFALRVTAVLPGQVSAPGALGGAQSGSVGWLADIDGLAASDSGQTFSATSTFGNDTRVADRVKQATPWFVAAWGALFLGVIVPVTLAVSRFRRRRGYADY